MDHVKGDDMKAHETVTDARPTQPNTVTWLVFLLRSPLVIAYSDTDPGELFTADGVQYREAVFGHVVATFDRLVGADSRLLGVQIWPVAAYTQGFLRALPQHDYLRVYDDLYVQLYFGAGESADAESSGDQSLLGRIYRSSSGEFAIAVDRSALAISDADLAAASASITQS